MREKGTLVAIIYDFDKNCVIKIYRSIHLFLI